MCGSRRHRSLLNPTDLRFKHNTPLTDVGCQGRARAPTTSCRRTQNQRHGEWRRRRGCSQESGNERGPDRDERRWTHVAADGSTGAAGEADCLGPRGDGLRRGRAWLGLPMGEWRPGRISPAKACSAGMTRSGSWSSWPTGVHMVVRTKPPPGQVVRDPSRATSTRSRRQPREPLAAMPAPPASPPPSTPSLSGCCLTRSPPVLEAHNSPDHRRDPRRL
jgi:hypothetical protein